ncbi:hypothetical protein A1Q2_04501 [Trichosporon asahii var. asahii CBS 8904]|uniref:Uncharacterized protein n=1 Tax=Trichosporon asahii var. asahii (strain CBS 8904) TaxID=1220162 RepID=K1VWL4_TRIAC|nr:hypothetical protein A1Q2_04501 [Trichosporon asahii var. asahii CBS 8904]
MVFANFRSFLRGYELPALPPPPSTERSVSDVSWILLFLQGRLGLQAPVAHSSFLKPRPGTVEFVLDRDGPVSLFSVLERHLRAHPIATEVGQFTDAARLFTTIFTHYPPVADAEYITSLLRDLLLVPARLIEGLYFEKRAVEDETVRDIRWEDVSERTMISFANKYAGLVPLLEPVKSSPGKRKRSSTVSRVVPTVLSFEVQPERSPLVLTFGTVIGTSNPVLAIEVVSSFTREDILALHAALLNKDGSGLSLEAAGYADPIVPDCLRVKLQAPSRVPDGVVTALLEVFGRMMLHRRTQVVLTNWDVFLTLRLAPDGRVHVSPPYLRDRRGIPRHLPPQGPLELLVALQLVMRLNTERGLRKALDLKGGEEVEVWNYNGAHWFAVRDGKSALSVG